MIKRAFNFFGFSIGGCHSLKNINKYRTNPRQHTGSTSPSTAPRQHGHYRTTRISSLYPPRLPHECHRSLGPAFPGSFSPTILVPRRYFHDHIIQQLSGHHRRQMQSRVGPGCGIRAVISTGCRPHESTHFSPSFPRAQFLHSSITQRP